MCVYCGNTFIMTFITSSIKLWVIDIMCMFMIKKKHFISSTLNMNLIYNFNFLVVIVFDVLTLLPIIICTLP